MIKSFELAIEINVLLSIGYTDFLYGASPHNQPMII